jgi:DNA-binding MarR family transcriptional regulator
MKIYPQQTEQIAAQFLDLIPHLFHMRGNLLPPEPVLRFQEQIESTRRGRSSLAEYSLLFRVFMTLTHRQDPPTMGELGGELGLPCSSATRLVDWLVRANLVERIADRHDRRLVRVRLTDSGQQMHLAAQEHNKRQILRLLSYFSSAEQEQLLHLMHKLSVSLLAEKENITAE